MFLFLICWPQWDRNPVATLLCRKYGGQFVGLASKTIATVKNINKDTLHGNLCTHFWFGFVVVDHIAEAARNSTKRRKLREYRICFSLTWSYMKTWQNKAMYVACILPFFQSCSSVSRLPTSFSGANSGDGERFEGGEPGVVKYWT